MKEISIVIPTLNEAGNIAMLIERISNSFVDSGIKYEILFIDDHSSDATVAEVAKFARTHPVRLFKKTGTRGKAYSLLQGFGKAKYNTICMIDADLQYPPEAIVPMYELMYSSGSDVVLTERVDNATSRLRKLSSATFNFVFTRMLFGFNYDSQSGLKLFRKSVVERIKLNPTPWSFDLEFIVRALEQNYKIMTYQIPFSQRFAGEAKVDVLKVTYELAKASLSLRLNTASPAEVKRAYRSSVEFAEKAMAVLAIVAVASLGLAFAGTPSKASALSLPIAAQSVQAAQAAQDKTAQAVAKAIKAAAESNKATPYTFSAAGQVLGASTTANNTATPAAAATPVVPVVTPIIAPILTIPTASPVATPVQGTVPVAATPQPSSSSSSYQNANGYSSNTAFTSSQPASADIQTAIANLGSGTKGITITYPSRNASADFNYRAPSTSKLQKYVGPLLKTALVISMGILLILDANALINLFKRKRDTTLV